MNQIQEYIFLFNNVVIWAIFATAFLCYGLLIELCFVLRCDDGWYERTLFWSTSIKHLLSALPLLGLLGTISGLMETFTRMAVEKGFAIQEVISGGIADAMFTTELGLIMVVPGLLMLALLNFKKKGWIIQKAHEIND